VNRYGIDIWSDNNFVIEGDKVKLNGFGKPAIVDIVKKIRDDGNRGPLLLRFPHITQKQIDKLYISFNKSIKEYSYDGNFNAVFPLKVNQLPNFVLPLVKNGEKYNYGLEAGSKAELVLAMAYNNEDSPITINGFKDKEMITLAFIAYSMGHDTTITIEGLNELETIIEVYNEINLPSPKVGLRVRLHSSGSGVWAKSGGIDSKFGLSSTEILEAFNLLKNENLLDKLTMIHFHIGSAMDSIAPLKKALKESGHIYAELKQMGAQNLENINIGGGLGVEYNQFEKKLNYSLQEFSNDVVFTMQSIAKQKNVPQPNIFTESGRYIAAPSTILIAPVLELFSSEYEEKNLKVTDDSPDIIKELYSLYRDIKKSTAIEYMHDSLEHLESVLTLFDLGYINLQDRSNAEILTHLIIKKALFLLDFKHHTELKRIDSKIQERYLLNFSLFQSLPDFWGIDQEFPVMPLTHLDKKPTRSASLWDITCDSDGEIPFDNSKPLYLHDVDLQKEEYFLGFFQVGAYQDTLGMRHNLFTHPTEVDVVFDEDGMKLENLIESQKILDILDDIDYDIDFIQQKLRSKVTDDKLWSILDSYLHDNGYLKTTKE